MPEIVKPAGTKDSKRFWGISEVHLTSIQELLELAETLEIPVVLQVGSKKFMLLYDGMKFIAEQ